MSYMEKLRDPRWQKARLEAMSRAGFKCERCGNHKSTLAVHHRYYERGIEPWEYPQQSLMCLCEECHKQEQEGMECTHQLIGMLRDDERIYGYLWGLMVLQMVRDAGLSFPLSERDAEQLADLYAGINIPQLGNEGLLGLSQCLGLRVCELHNEQKVCGRLPLFSIVFDLAHQGSQPSTPSTEIAKLRSADLQAGAV